MFERVSRNEAIWEVLIELEQATSPRVRDEIGEINLVPPDRRVSGLGASYIMASFTHINPKGSRFSDGSYGVYYCADRLNTAIAETVHQFGRFAEDSGDPSRGEDMRVVCGSVSATLHDVETLPKAERSRILNPDSYAASRPFAAALRAAGSDGLFYPSVRDAAGRCVAAFWPDVVGIPVEERYLRYEWNGARVSRYFDYSTNTWVPL